MPGLGSAVRTCVRILLGILLAVAGAAGPAPAAIQDRLTVGLNAFKDGFYELSAKELRAYLEARPEDPRRAELLFLLARCEITLERWDDAAAVLARLVALDGPRSREARYLLGWVEARAGRPEAALAHLQTYLSAPGAQLGDAADLAAQLAQQLGRQAAAADYLRRFLAAAPAADPRRGPAWGRLVELLNGAERHADALAAAREGLLDPALDDSRSRAAVALGGAAAARSLGRPADEVAFLAALLEEDGAADRDLHLALADALRRAGQLERAQGVLTALLADLLADDRGAAAVRLQLVEILRQQGDRRAELAQLERLLGNSPADGASPSDLRRRALALALELGDDRAATAHARALLADEASLGPAERGAVHGLLGRAARRAGQPVVAAEHWLQVPAAAPGYRDARLAAARTLLEFGRHDAAFKAVAPLLKGDDPGREAHLAAWVAALGGDDLERIDRLADALVRDPPPGHDAAGLLLSKAEAHARRGDAAGRLAALEQLAVQFPRDPRTPWAAGRLLEAALARDQWSAVARWAEVAEGDPEARGWARFSRARALEESGRAAAAQELYRALAAEPGEYQGRALAWLGTAADQAGEGAAAVEYYTRALGAGVGDETAAWIRARVGELQPPTPDGGGAGAQP